MMPQPTLAELFACLPHHPPTALAKIKCAYRLAERAHQNQHRDEGAPYIEHPVRVALIVAAELERREGDLICAALLHDVVEDSPITLAEIQETCGDTVAHFVELLTKAKDIAPEHKRQANREYLRRIAADSDEVVLLKLADRLDNLRSVALIPDWDKRRKYLLETYWQYLPFAQRGSDYIYDQYTSLLAAYMRQHGEQLQLDLDDFPELIGQPETRRNS